MNGWEREKGLVGTRVREEGEAHTADEVSERTWWGRRGRKVWEVRE